MTGAIALIISRLRVAYGYSKIAFSLCQNPFFCGCGFVAGACTAGCRSTNAYAFGSTCSFITRAVSGGPAESALKTNGVSATTCSFGLGDGVGAGGVGCGCGSGAGAAFTTSTCRTGSGAGGHPH